MVDIILGSVIALVVLAVIAWMVRNVKRGKTFCGAEYGDPLNTGNSHI